MRYTGVAERGRLRPCHIKDPVVEAAGYRNHSSSQLYFSLVSLTGISATSDTCQLVLTLGKSKEKWPSDYLWYLIADLLSCLEFWIPSLFQYLFQVVWFLVYREGLRSRPYCINNKQCNSLFFCQCLRIRRVHQKNQDFSFDLNAPTINIIYPCALLLRAVPSQLLAVWPWWICVCCSRHPVSLYPNWGSLYQSTTHTHTHKSKLKN